MSTDTPEPTTPNQLAELQIRAVDDHSIAVALAFHLDDGVGPTTEIHLAAADFIFFRAALNGVQIPKTNTPRKGVSFAYAS